MAPSDLRATSVTHEQVSLAWNASQSNVMNYIVAMREIGMKKFKTVAKVDGSQLTCSLTTGFEQNQEYIFRVFAENEVTKRYAVDCCELCSNFSFMFCNICHSNCLIIIPKSLLPQRNDINRYKCVLQCYGCKHFYRAITGFARINLFPFAKFS